VLTAHLAAVNFGSNGYVRCGIEAAGESSFGSWGSAASVGDTAPFSRIGQIYISLPVTSQYAFTPKLLCRQDYSTQAYVEETRLMAIVVGETHLRGDGDRFGLTRPAAPVKQSRQWPLTIPVRGPASVRAAALR
jgi:hypothetical protein